MSYCRWSSDNWRCDLYCYEDCGGGWTTHVAGNRLVGEIPEARMPRPGATDADWQTYGEAHSAQMKWLDTATREPIGLPHDGESFNDSTLAEFKDRLLSLRAIGYRFPDYVLDEVEQELTGATHGGLTAGGPPAGTDPNV